MPYQLSRFVSIDAHFSCKLVSHVLDVFQSTRYNRKRVVEEQRPILIDPLLFSRLFIGIYLVRRCDESIRYVARMINRWRKRSSDH